MLSVDTLSSSCATSSCTTFVIKSASSTLRIWAREAFDYVIAKKLNFFPSSESLQAIVVHLHHSKLLFDMTVLLLFRLLLTSQSPYLEYQRSLAGKCETAQSACSKKAEFSTHQGSQAKTAKPRCHYNFTTVRTAQSILPNSPLHKF